MGRRGLSGHPDVTWCIAVEATLAASVDLATSVARGSAAVGREASRLGPPPRAEHWEEAHREAMLDRVLNMPFPADGPYVRVAVVSGRSPRLILAAHHAILDGLGLVALLGEALSQPVRSSVSGLHPEARITRGFAATAASRVGRALLRPSLRIVPDGGEPTAFGDHLFVHRAPDEVAGTTRLVVAMGRTIERWNRSHGGRHRQVDVSVGASRRPGRSAGLEEDSAYMVVRLSQWDPVTVREVLRSGVLEPASPRGGAGRALDMVARPVARLLSPRLGSSALVSSLGRIEAPPDVEAVALYPVAHGRSGVALGAAETHGLTSLTFRMRRRSFGREAVARFAGVFLDELDRLSR